jgi:hypothetical protein
MRTHRGANRGRSTTGTREQQPLARDERREVAQYEAPINGVHVSRHHLRTAVLATSEASGPASDRWRALSYWVHAGDRADRTRHRLQAISHGWFGVSDTGEDLRLFARARLQRSIVLCRPLGGMRSVTTRLG